MANKRRGQQTFSNTQRWQHLRPFGKMIFWGQQRAFDREQIRKDLLNPEQEEEDDEDVWPGSPERDYSLPVM